MPRTAPSADRWAAIRERGAVVIPKAACSREEFEELTQELACEFFVHHNPSRTRLNADGTSDTPVLCERELPANWLAEVRALADDLTVDIRWSAGDVAIVDNTRWLHGRRAFPADSDRSILVRMGNVVPGFRDRPEPVHFTRPAGPR